MRVNGNHIDRLIYSVLPIIICIGTLFYFLTPKKSAILGFVLTSAAFWAMDTILLRFKRPKTMRIEDGQLWVGRELVDVKDIQSITPISDKRFRWSFELVEIQIPQIGEITIIVRPFPFWYLGDKSKSIDILVSNFPFLSEKVHDRRFI